MAPHPLLRTLLVSALACACHGASAADPKPKQPPAPAAARAPIVEPEPARGEPVVQNIVIDDKDTRIEELHVRGEAKRITVKPKAAPKLQYEVIPAGGERDLAPGPGSTRGAAGQRVWNILNF
jgi:hypothetical protein